MKVNSINCTKKFGDKGRFTNFAPPKDRGDFIILKYLGYVLLTKVYGEVGEWLKPVVC